MGVYHPWHYNGPHEVSGIVTARAYGGCAIAESRDPARRRVHGEPRCGRELRQERSDKLPPSNAMGVHLLKKMCASPAAPSRNLDRCADVVI